MSVKYTDEQRAIARIMIDNYFYGSEHKQTPHQFTLFINGAEPALKAAMTDWFTGLLEHNINEIKELISTKEDAEKGQIEIQFPFMWSAMILEEFSRAELCVTAIRYKPTNRNTVVEFCQPQFIDSIF